MQSVLPKLPTNLPILRLTIRHPRKFFLSVINNEPVLHPVRVILNEAKRFGINILAPHISRSQGKSSLEDNVIRVGLSQVREMGSSSLEEILKEREKESLKFWKNFVFG